MTFLAGFGKVENNEKTIVSELFVNFEFSSTRTVMHTGREFSARIMTNRGSKLPTSRTQDVFVELNLTSQAIPFAKFNKCARL